MHPSGLDDSIGFAIGVTYRKLSAFLAARIKEHDLTPEQWSVLCRIGEKDCQIQKEIAERAGKDHPTTTRILDLLAAKGFLERRPGTRDRRSYEITITEKGRRAVDAVWPIERDTIRKAREGVTDEEYAVVMKVLAAINRNIDRENERE